MERISLSKICKQMNKNPKQVRRALRDKLPARRVTNSRTDWSVPANKVAQVKAIIRNLTA